MISDLNGSLGILIRELFSSSKLLKDNLHLYSHLKIKLFKL